MQKKTKQSILFWTLTVMLALIPLNIILYVLYDNSNMKSNEFFALICFMVYALLNWITNVLFPYLTGASIFRFENEKDE